MPVELPDLKGREEILKVHAKKVKIAPGVDFNTVARMASGASGAAAAASGAAGADRASGAAGADRASGAGADRANGAAGAGSGKAAGAANAVREELIVIIKSETELSPEERTKLQNWLKVRLNSENLRLICQ